MLKKWEELPDFMKNDSVRKYYDILYKNRLGLIVKRLFDILVSIFTLIILSPIFVFISIAIKVDSEGPVFFRQIRVTQYGERFRIYKFRTMVLNAEKIGAQVTTKDDKRVTKIGQYLRKSRLDEIPQLLNILSGDMSFVGTRPEVIKYVEKYTDEMVATLLLPAGVTSKASIQYKDEELLLANTANADETYINKVLPEKMKYNLRNLEQFSIFGEIKTMVETIFAVTKKDKNK
jgi:lipopolysaccharide/colanic/teichoic acid biosynthesis glycosyltransferase